ncbi:MAG TPA: MBL fold metallo-hydrolase [Polyangiaceae bacterium]|jgi:L-ascorbate metabolism protein UlaG (beta-lactamase superfamily)|nr:MBL fold metallo-hydrolase [Polyangiaceae bacterium]
MARAKILFPLALLLTGCGFIGRTLQRTLDAPSEPAKVANKIRDPRRADARLSVLWIGHATALVQIDDVFVLTDPVFTRTVGQLSPRLVEPGLDPADLPPLAAVLISHMHFDHLSYDSLSMIEDKTPIVLLPPGAKASVPRYTFDSRELDRWESYEAGGVRVTAVPVRHVGGRWGIDQAWNARAFTGYVFQYHGISVYFGGDTAFDGEHFAETRVRFPALSLALLPICPTAPRDFMRRTHMDSLEALDAFSVLGARWMVPVHYDTFINSDDQPGDCPRLLAEHMRERGLGDDHVAILAIGEQRVLIAR